MTTAAVQDVRCRAEALDPGVAVLVDAPIDVLVAAFYGADDDAARTAAVELAARVVAGLLEGVAA